MNLNDLQKGKIAIVHDGLVVQSGSERFTLFLSDVFPSAPIYTAAYIPQNTYPDFQKKTVITLPFGRKIKTERQFKGLFPWWYFGISTLDLSQYDIVISSANYLAKYIVPPSHTTHVCYLHNPFRFLWKPDVYSIYSLPYEKHIVSLIKLMFPLFRKIDVARTKKIKHILTNSHNIARQVQRIYDVEPQVIYPPVKINDFSIAEQIEDYYLYVGRLISHKRVDLAIQACAKLKRKLLVVGEGLEQQELQKLTSDTTRFLGRVSEERLRHLYSHCRALIFPSDEDFGLVPVEVQASGRPVIAYRAGGALETVIENQTGIFFSEQSVDSICEAIQRFEGAEFSPVTIRANAERFDISIFSRDILDYLQKLPGI